MYSRFETCLPGITQRLDIRVGCVVAVRGLIVRRSHAVLVVVVLVVVVPTAAVVVLVAAVLWLVAEAPGAALVGTLVSSFASWL